MKPGIPAEEELRVKSLMESKGFQIHESRGANFTLFGVVGDTAAFDMNQLRVYDCIDKVMRVQEPYKRCLLYTSWPFDGEPEITENARRADRLR